MTSQEKENDQNITEEISLSNEKKLSSGTDEGFKWYVVHVLSGHENKVCKSLRERIFNHNLENSFSEIYVPEESVVTNVKGKKRTIKKKFFPGYILIKMIMNDRTWHVVKNTDKITGFIGSNKVIPTPISDEEAMLLTNQVAEGFKRPKASSNFSEGDSVRVIEGPFTSFIGTIETVSEKGKIRVQVSIFGRPTPVELDFTQVEKV
jgi:transcriptional antiterminator NusG